MTQAGGKPLSGQVRLKEADMTGLQEAFYIIGIIFMSIIFILIAALVAAVFIIKSKINHIHDAIEEKVNTITNLAEAGGKLSAMAGSVVAKKAKKAARKSKK